MVVRKEGKGQSDGTGGRVNQTTGEKACCKGALGFGGLGEGLATSDKEDGERK